MIVARSDIRYEGTQCIERCIVAFFNLAFHVFLDFVQGYMARSFDEGLYILGPGTDNQFAHCIKFGKLSLIVGILDTSRTETVAQ